MNNFLFRVKIRLFFFLFLSGILSSCLNAAVWRDSIVLPQSGQLPLFGFHLFKENNLPNPLSTYNLPSADYRLALNDKISIQIIGRSQANFVFSIDEKGFISPDKMPGIFLAGLTFLQAKKVLSAHFSRFYTFSSGQFIVSMVPSGKIRVYVLGNVQEEGFYELTAMSNVFQAIAAAGGPTNRASIRNIKMIQQGKASNLDVYAFSSYPNGEIPMQLHDLDIVHLPVSKTVVSLTGAIHRPLKYEVLDGECLGDMIHFGGGLLASANVQYAKLFRYTENVQLQIDIYLPPYLAGKSCFTFQPGDSLVFKEINELSQNRVKISGAVLFPGFYGLDSSGSIQSLFKKAILSEGASKDQFTLLRKDENGALGIKKMSLKASEWFVDVELMAGDEIIIDFKSKFKEEFTIEVAGNVKVPFVRSFPPAA
ncbi:MAG: SLBB domain-containing protein [Saprospiraceae bacterium]|nr:SLBB domain-containing protein [Saprospiraceae bacterium]